MPFEVPGMAPLPPPPEPSLPPPPEIPGLPLPFPPAAPPPPPVRTAGAIAVDAALSKLGSDYDYGATGPDAFDCAGLVQWAYREAGVELPRISYDQLAAGAPISISELQPGDVVSFYGGSHSALYAGDGRVVHAATYGVGVTLAAMSSMPFAGAVRF